MSVLSTSKCKPVVAGQSHQRQQALRHSHGLPQCQIEQALDRQVKLDGDAAERRPAAPLAIRAA